MANLLRSKADDSCIRCGKRGRDFGKSDPAAWLDLRGVCQICVNVETCGGVQATCEELRRLTQHQKGETPTGSLVTLRAQGVAARTREGDALMRGLPLPRGLAGTIVGFSGRGEGALYKVKLADRSITRVAPSAVRYADQLLDIPYVVE